MICGVCNESMTDPCTAMCGCTFCHKHAFSTFKPTEEEEASDSSLTSSEEADIREGTVVILPHGRAAVVNKREGNVLVVSLPQGRTRVLARDVEVSAWLTNLKVGDLVTIPSKPGRPSAGAIIACHYDGIVAVETQPEGYVWEGPLSCISPYTKLSVEPFTFPLLVPNSEFADAFEGMESFDHNVQSWTASCSSNNQEPTMEIPLSADLTLEEFIAGRLLENRPLSTLHLRSDQDMHHLYQALTGSNLHSSTSVDSSQNRFPLDPRPEIEEDILEQGAVVRLTFPRNRQGFKYGVGRIRVKRDHVGIVQARRLDGSYTVHFAAVRNAHFRRCELEKVDAPKEGSLVRISPNFSEHRAAKLAVHAVGKLVSVTYNGGCLVDFGEFHKDLQLGDRSKLWQCNITDFVEDSRSEHDPVFPLPKCPLCNGALGEVIRLDKAIASKDFTCGICGDILADPVTLGCGHSFCYMELQLWFRSNDSCPICRERFPSLGATVREKVILRRFMNFPAESSSRGGAVFERKERVVLHAIHKMHTNREIEKLLEEKYGDNIIFERRLAVHADTIHTILSTQQNPETMADRYSISNRLIDFFKEWGTASIRGLIQTGVADLRTEKLVKDHTMLMFAAQASLDAVNTLLGMGADLTYCVEDGISKGFTALSCAAMAGKTEIVEVIADLAPKSHLPVAIREAMKAGHGQLALRLRERLSTEDVEQNSCRRSCAVLACRLGDVDLLSRFVEYFDDPIEERSEDVEPDVKILDCGVTELDNDYGHPTLTPDFISRQTPLEACSSQKCVQYVLERSDCSPNLSLPFHSSCASSNYKRFPEVLDAYIAGGFDVNARDADGRSALFFIWRSGNDDARVRLEALIDRGAISDLPDRQGRQVLHLAAAVGDIGVFEALIGHSPWPIDHRGQSPLHLACRFGRKSFIDHILTCKNPHWDLKQECTRKDANNNIAYSLLSPEIRNTCLGESLRKHSVLPKRGRQEGGSESADGGTSRRPRMSTLRESPDQRMDCSMQ